MIGLTSIAATVNTSTFVVKPPAAIVEAPTSPSELETPPIQRRGEPVGGGLPMRFIQVLMLMLALLEISLNISSVVLRAFLKC